MKHPRQKLPPLAGSVVLTVAVFLTSACTKPKSPAFHVITADKCDRPSVIGVIGKKEFALDVLPDDRPLGVACFGYFGMQDVGVDFPATVDLKRETVAVQIAGTWKTLMIEKVREVQ